MHSENIRLHEALAKLDSQDPRVAVALAATRAHWHASSHRWAEATQEFDRLQQFDPDAPHDWLKATGLVRVARALFGQNQPARGSELLAAASRQLDADGITRVNLIGILFLRRTASPSV
ncbi:MAG: hypothetical protein O2856_03005 [Planctomycetota bacterium]|nr:hypothetical protein [Planctomycetota bacterium]